MRAKRNAYVTRDLIALTRVDEDLYRGSLALTELRKDRGKGRERKENEKKRKEKKRNGIVEERKGGKRQEEVLALGTTRPVSKTRRAKPEGKGGRETLLPKIYGATGNTRTLLVTSWWTPRALTALYIYIYHMIQKHRVIFIFLHRERVVSVLSIVLPSLFFAFLPRTRQESCRGTCDHHHYARAFLLSFSTSSSSSSSSTAPHSPSTYSTNALRHGVRACVLPRLLRHLRQRELRIRCDHIRLRDRRCIWVWHYRIFLLFFFLILHESEKYRGGCIRNFRYAIRMNYRRRVVWLIGRSRRVLESNGIVRKEEKN